MSKSIVTLQLGNYSNFIGSHYWNLHEFSFKNSNTNFNNDVTYYEGLTTNNSVTFTPKVISWDWKENLGPRIVDDIYEEIENQGLNNAQSRREPTSLKVNSYKGKVEMNTGFTADELNVNKSQQILDKDYKEWNEYLYARLHPNSLTKLPKLYRNFNSDNFRNFSQGMDLTQTGEYFDKMEDQTRYFVEKCDMLQGFQVICDVDDGFSGVGINFLNQLADEYSKDIISFPASCSLASDDSIDNLFNKIFLFNEMNSKSIFWSPISVFNGDSAARLPNVDYDPSCKYHTSAILAVALKSLLLPCFLSSGAHTLSDYSSVIDRQNNKLASLAISLPFPIRQNNNLANALLNLRPSDCFSQLNPLGAPGISSMDKIDSLVGNIFGVDCSRARNDLGPSKIASVVETMESFIDQHCASRNCRFVSIDERIPLLQPFPRIFSADIDGLSGELVARPGSDRYRHCPLAVPVATTLFANANSSHGLLPLVEAAERALKSRRMPSMMMQLEPDYLTEAVENFRAMI